MNDAVTDLNHEIRRSFGLVKQGEECCLDVDLSWPLCHVYVLNICPG